MSLGSTTFGPEPEGQLIIDYLSNTYRPWRLISQGVVLRRYATWEEALEVALKVNKLANQKESIKIKLLVSREKGIPYGGG